MSQSSGRGFKKSATSNKASPRLVAKRRIVTSNEFALTPNEIPDQVPLMCEPQLISESERYLRDKKDRQLEVKHQEALKEQDRLKKEQENSKNQQEFLKMLEKNDYTYD